MKKRSADVVAELARLSGGMSFDADDAHSRWNVYLHSMGNGNLAELLKEAVELEEDNAVALSIVLHILGDRPAHDRDSWVLRLRAEKDRVYAARRKDELAVLERVRREVRSDVEEAAPAEWSDWLQIRSAESGVDTHVVGWLAENGRTKRIRRTAQARLEDLNAHPRSGDVPGG